MAHDVFISYCHGDEAVVEAVCRDLESHGIRCWYARRDIAPGAGWAGAIIEAIRGCRIFLLLFSAGSNASQQVLNEVDNAQGLSKIILPFRLDRTEMCDDMAYYLSRRHWLDASDPPLEQHIETLRGRILDLIGSAPEGSSPAGVSPAEPSSAGESGPDAAPWQPIRTTPFGDAAYTPFIPPSAPESDAGGVPPFLRRRRRGAETAPLGETLPAETVPETGAYDAAPFRRGIDQPDQFFLLPPYGVCRVIRREGNRWTVADAMGMEHTTETELLLYRKEPFCLGGLREGAPAALDVILILDTSADMDGDKIRSLELHVNEMLETLRAFASSRVSLSVGVIGTGRKKAEVIRPLTPVSRGRRISLRAEGTARLGAAMTLAKEMIEEKTAGRAAVILATGGLPVDAWSGPMDELCRFGRSAESFRAALLTGPEDEYALRMLNDFVSEGEEAETADGLFNDIGDFFGRMTLRLVQATYPDP